MGETFKTVIEFVDNAAPNNVMNFETAATGDYTWIVLFLISALLIVISLFWRVKWIKKIPIICIASIFCVFAISVPVFANQKISVPDKIQAVVNEETNTIEINDCSIKSVNDETFKITLVDANYIDPGFSSNCIWNLKAAEQNIYNMQVPGSNKIDVSFKNKIDISFNIQNMPIDIAKSLIGKQVAEFSFTLEPIDNKYEIYPIPQNLTYTQDKFDIRRTINVVRSDKLDSVTNNKLEKMLDNKGLSYQYSTIVRDDMPNIIAGIDTSLADHNDAYTLTIDNNNINITGYDTNAVFRALTTLQMIFDQTNDSFVLGLNVADYADTRLRGIIEGFYGIPWSAQNRKDLIEFASKFKMNTYIFAPKDDIYHGAQWRTKYPTDELSKMKDLVDKGIETKVDFTWAIHPFRENPFNFNNYEADINAIKAKYQQLYDIGVRNFGLSADDIVLEDPATAEQQEKVIVDLNDWCLSHEGCGHLIFVPQYYHQGSADTIEGHAYYNVIKNSPDTVDIMWTGNNWLGHTFPESFAYFNQIANRQAYMWFNWPVNDYIKDADISKGFTHMLLGKADMLIDGSINYIGLVSNPMQQAQASKSAVISVAQYCWSNSKFNREQVWKDSFKYFEPGAAIALNNIAYHLSYSTDQCMMNFDESENMLPYITDIENSMALDSQINPHTHQSLVNIYDDLLNNISLYTSNHTNAALYEEIKPWLDSFNLEIPASIDLLNAIEMYHNGDVQAAKDLWVKAKSNFEQSTKIIVPTIDGSKIYAEPGSKRIKPLIKNMITYLDTKFL